METLKLVKFGWWRWYLDVARHCYNFETNKSQGIEYHQWRRL